MDVINSLGSIATGLASLCAAFIAREGLRTWRQQLIGKSNYEVARRLLRSVLELRETLRAARGRFVPAGEIAEAFRLEGIDPETVDIPRDSRARYLVWKWRWQPVVDALTSLEAEAIEAEILWGKEVHELLCRSRSMVGKLHFAKLRELAWRENGRDAFEESKYLDIVYASGDGDKFDEEFEEIVSDFCALLRPHLR